jgi:2-phosphosulfolactate phosphatase
MTIESILSPLELPALAGHDWRGTVCVVFDVLRATSAFITALNNGAADIIPVAEIAEAVALRKSNPRFLLAGERDGVRIRATQSGGINFDLGNSPREFTPDIVRGKTVVSTTTNGTRALRACAGAEIVLASSFLNLAATADFLHGKDFAKVLLICAGTHNDVALEDVLAAGAMIELLMADMDARPAVSDSSRIAHDLFVRLKPDLAAAIAASKNGRRLLSLPELRDDVAYCTQRDLFDLVALMCNTGRLSRV